MYLCHLCPSPTSQSFYKKKIKTFRENDGYVGMGMYLIMLISYITIFLPKLIKTQQSCVTLTVLDCDVGDEHD